MSENVSICKPPQTTTNSMKNFGMLMLVTRDGHRPELKLKSRVDFGWCRAHKLCLPQTIAKLLLARTLGPPMHQTLPPPMHLSPGSDTNVSLLWHVLGAVYLHHFWVASGVSGVVPNATVQCLNWFWQGRVWGSGLNSGPPLTVNHKPNWGFLVCVHPWWSPFHKYYFNNQKLSRINDKLHFVSWLVLIPRQKAKQSAVQFQ